MTESEDADISIASRLNRRLAIDDITLAGLEARPIAFAQSTNGHWSYAMSHQKVRWDLSQGTVFAVFPFEVLIEQSDDAGKKPLALLRVAFRSIYKALDELDEEAISCIRHFLALVGWMQVWPYIRAEIHQLSSRLGYPPLVLPILLSGQTASVPVERVRADEPANGESLE